MLLALAVRRSLVIRSLITSNEHNNIMVTVMMDTTMKAVDRIRVPHRRRKVISTAGVGIGRTLDIIIGKILDLEVGANAVCSSRKEC